jgi:tungstate transport system substrate-binding protein
MAIRRRPLVLLAALLAAALAAGASALAAPARPEVILSTTTSTMDSGLLDVLIPMFERRTGYRVKPIAVGTGQALALAERGEADVVLAHAPASERQLVDAGHVERRTLVMHNDFVLVGPPADPANVKGARDVAQALGRIAGAGALFVSRGDDSGTHKKELDLWAAAGVAPAGPWYQESGLGMGQTLSIASEKSAYTLCDRATYLALRKNLRLDVVSEGNRSLRNVYHVMNVNRAKHPKVNAEGGKAFVDFMVSREAQDVIRTFGVDKYGSPLFFPDAGKSEGDVS